jgi:hypothetical protein
MKTTITKEEQRQRVRRSQLAFELTQLVYGDDYSDLSESEIRAVLVDILHRSIHQSMRPKRP